jgi:hypothetical protein
MKKQILITLMALLVSSASIFAQNSKTSPSKGAKSEENMNKRISLMNSKLGLNAADSAKFWPVYIQMTEELKANHKNFKSEKGDKKMSEMTDEEVKKIIDNGFSMRQKDLDIRKAYNDKFIALIGVKKVAELYMIEKNGRENHKNDDHKGKGQGGNSANPQGK